MEAQRAKRRVLVVEPNADARATILARLESLGLETLEANDADDALEILRRPGDVHFVYCDDHLMPLLLPLMASGMLSAEEDPTGQN